MLHIENRINIIMSGHYSPHKSTNINHHENSNFYKLCYIEDGSLSVKGNENSYILKARELYIINENNIPSYNFAQCSTFWIDFTPQNVLIEQALHHLPTVVKISQEVIEIATKHNIFSGDFSISAIKNHNPLQALKLGQIINEAIIDALNNHSWDEVCENNATFDKINIAIQYIDENFNKNITIESLAQMCNLSPNHFHRLFVSATKLTPVNYITKKRMTEALSLITTCHNIKEVAYLLGYCNDAYFSRTFHKTFGVTPGEFKKNLTSKQK